MKRVKALCTRKGIACHLTPVGRYRGFSSAVGHDGINLESIGEHSIEILKMSHVDSDAVKPDTTITVNKIR